MELDWPNIIGSLLLIAGLCGVIILAGVWLADKFNTPSTNPVKPVVRSADAGPPAGAVEWVIDIQTAMGASHASNVLEALADGCSRDQARARRIEQLEAHKPAPDMAALLQSAASIASNPWRSDPATAAFVSVASEQAISNAVLGVKAEVTP
jgi:hypothetical protein